jgi:hypothetical protein
MKIKIIIGIVAFVIIGIAIPKLTVHDSVSVDERLERCAQYATNEMLDNPFQRIALKLGKSRIVETDGRNRATIEVFTLFRIPLMGRIVAFCDQTGIPEQSIVVNKTGDPATQYPFGITKDELPDGWYMRSSQGIDNVYMVLTKDPNIPWPQYELGEFGEFILVEAHEIGDPKMWIKNRVDCNDVALNRSCTFGFLNGRWHLAVEHETPASDAQTDYFLDYGRVAIATLYPLDSDKETKTAYARFLYNTVAPIVGTAYSRTILQENCTQDIPREIIDDSKRDSENSVVTMYWWDGETQSDKSLSVLYEQETDFAGCSEPVKKFLRHLPTGSDKE